MRGKVLDNLIKSYSEYRIIITDRLHGMILCYITNTPCLIFKNTNHKISGSFKKWLKEKQNFICLEESDNPKDIIKDIGKLLSAKKAEKEDLSEKFNILREELR